MSKQLIRITVASLSLVLLIACTALSQSIRLKSGNFDPGAISAPGPVSLQSLPHDPYWLVQFSLSISDVDRELIKRTGAEIISYIPENAFLVRVPVSRLGMLQSIQGVRWVGGYLPHYRLSPDIPESGSLMRFHVLGFPGEDIQQIASGLKSRNVFIESITETSDGPLFVVQTNPVVARTLAYLAGVRWIEPLREVMLSNDASRDIINAVNATQSTGLFGDGQIVAVADTGLDVGADSPGLHPDFQDRIVAAFDLGRPGLTDDPNGHGTHVAGSVLGSGLLSGSSPATGDYAASFAGVAPQAGLVMQSILDQSGGLGGLPSDLTHLFNQAYNAGARVHSNSWGADVKGLYDIRARQVDEYLWQNRDMVILFSSGNQGQDTTLDGVIDPGSITSPATAKNAISVGASESMRLAGGIQFPYGTNWPAKFPVAPIATDLVSDNPDGMAAFSGRGPCKDGRIKPDIVAPGTNIVSTRSRHPGAGTGWGIYNNDYNYNGGTSMATPLTAGASAVVRQFYTDVEGINPSAALVKATLMCTAYDISPGQYGTGVFQEVYPRPESSQGWGRLDLQAAVNPNPPAAVQYIDNTTGLSTGGINAYEFTVVNASVPFRVLLAWTDYPGDIAASTTLVNDLDLTIHAPDATLYNGNGMLDRKNNVESVDILNPQEGTYTVTVSAYNVPNGPQPYALVVYGGLPRSYIAGQVLSTAGSPIPGVYILAESNNGAFSTTTDPDGNYIVNVVEGQYTVTPSKPGWSMLPTHRHITVTEFGVQNVNFTGSAPPASISGTVRKGITQEVSGLWESPHPYDNNQTITTVIEGPANAVRMRLYFTQIGTESNFDFVTLLSGTGTVAATYTGELTDFWSPWVEGNQIIVRLTSDGSITGYGWQADKFQATLPGVPVGGAVITDSRTGIQKVTGAAGTYTFTNLEPLPTSISGTLEKSLLLPSWRDINPIPGQAVVGQDFVVVPEAPIASIAISHSYVGDLVVRVGIGNPENPIWSQVLFNRQGGNATNLTADIALDDALEFFPPTYERPWFLTVCDEELIDAGYVVGFSVSLHGRTYPAMDLPAEILDLQCTTVKIPFEPPLSIGEAKHISDGLPVFIWDQIVTAVFPDRFYIQDPMGASAISVTLGPDVEVGDIIAVRGNAGQWECEKTISAMQVAKMSSGQVQPRPMHMIGKSIGGKAISQHSPGFTDTDVLSTEGLLISTTGRVTTRDQEWFYISDGSEAQDLSGNRGIRVAAPGLQLPSAGSIVTVTGISGCMYISGDQGRVIYVRGQDDIRIQIDPQLIFFDDFESGSGNWSPMPGIDFMLINNSKSYSGDHAFLSRNDTIEAAVHHLTSSYSSDIVLYGWFYDEGDSTQDSQLMELRASNGTLVDRYSIGLHTPVSATHYSVFTKQDGWKVSSIPRKSGWVRFGIQVRPFTGGLDDIRFLVDGDQAALGSRVQGSAVNQIVLGNMYLLGDTPGFWDDILLKFGE